MRAAGGDSKIASNLMKGKTKCRISAKARAAIKAKRGLRKGGKRRKAAIGAGVFGAKEMGVSMFTNPRKKRRGSRKGGRKMATKTKRRRKGWTRAKRARAGRKAWRTRQRRYPKKRSSVGRRGYRNNPRKRRRRNTWRDDAAGHRKAAKKGWRRRRKSRRKNPASANPRKRRRRNSMYSGRLYANPKRRRRNARRGRRNPNGNGGLASITKTLTDPKMLMQFAVGAAGATVSEMLGSILAGKIAEFSPTTFVNGGMASKLLGAASRIVAGVAVAMFLPSQFKMAWIMGSGAVAAQPLVSGLLKPVLDPLAEALSPGVKSVAGLRGGIGGWISAAEVYGMRGLAGRGRGVGAWLTAGQLPGVGVAGLGYNTGQYAYQPGMQAAFTM
jgi:hypothetical protein